MARIESKLKAGAYPLEEDKRNMLANIIRPYAGDAMQGILVDPFCNNGDTANFLAKSWNMEWYGVEIQKELAREAQEKHGLNRVIYGDAYDVTISHGSIDVLYLNPPYDTDPTTGLFDSNRSEVTALSNLLKYVSLDGMIILVMYAHNVNADIFRHMLKATNRLMFFRFPEPHLGRYNQVVIIGIRQRGYSPPMALEIGDKIDKLLKWFTPEQSMKLPDISKGVPKAYHAHTFGHEKIRLPEPIRVRDWTFVSRKPDWETDTMLFSQFGPQHQKEFLDVCQPPPPHQKIRPPAKMTDNHAAILLNAEIIGGVEITHNDKKAIIRGSTKHVTFTHEEEEMDHDAAGAATRMKQVFDTKPVQFVTIINEDGIIEEIDQENLVSILKEHKEVISAEIDKNVQPLFDNNIDPFFAEVYDTRQVEGQYWMKPAQEQVATAATEFLLKNRYLLIAAEMRFGKAAQLDTNILTPNGWKKMGDMQVGDKVIGSDGKPHNVIGVFPQGKKKIYRVTFSDGSSTECCDEHLWTYNTPLRKWRGMPSITKELGEIMQKPLCHANGNPQIYIPVVEPVEFSEKELPIDPYLLGVLIGDGSLSGSDVRFTTPDSEMVESIKKLLPNGHSVIQKDEYNYRITSSGRRDKNTLVNLLRQTDLLGKTANEKFIPNDYLFGSIEQRLALLQGLMDTDGTCEGKNKTATSFTTISKQLADDMRHLVWSLGGIATISSKEPWYTGKNGERVYCQVAYRIGIKMPIQFQGQEFRLSRQLEAMGEKSKFAEPVRSMSSIEYVGTEEAQCIATDAKDQLYVTDDFIVTHNTPLTLAMIENAWRTQKLKDLAISGNKEAMGIANRINARYPGMKLADWRGIKPGEVVIIACPTNLPKNWMKHIELMLPDSHPKLIESVDDVVELFDHADANKEQIHIGVITFTKLKLGEGWENMPAKRFRPLVDVRKEKTSDGRTKIIKMYRAFDPVTGAPVLLSGRGNSKVHARPEDIDNNKRKIAQMWIENQSIKLGDKREIKNRHTGEINNIPVEIYPTGENANHAKFKDRDVKVVTKLPVWGLVRKFGVSSLVGNGRVVTNKIEHITETRKGIQPVFEMDWRTKKNKLKVVGTKEYEVKPNTIIREKVEKNILAEEPILDNFIARKGLRVYETYKDKDGNVHPRRGKDGKVIPRNPRLPIVDFLRHNYAKRIAMVFIDEVHAAQGIDTDVGKALRNLAYISKRSVGLTGTLYGGTASSIYSLLFTFNDKVRERFPWPYGFPWDWVNRMGAIREEYTKKREGSGAYAGWTRYSKSSVKEIPGYSAEMFKLIIENTIFASLKDHGEDIVPYEERVEWVEMSEDQTAQFKIASSVITDYNRGRIASGDYSFIGAMYTNLRFWPTAAFRSQKVEHIIKLDKGAKKSTEDNTKPQHVYTIPSVVDGDEVLPKEEKLIEKLTWALSDERKSLVFVEQTSKRDIQDRLEKLIKDHVPGANPFVLRSNSKSSADRIGFVDQKVEEGCNIMICNPALIREGVDMQWASHIVVYEMPTVSRTFAQAVKRPWGLKQKRNVVVEIIPYDDGLYEALGLQIAASKNAAISVIHGHEGDALAQESNDVDLMTDIKSLIRQGRIDQIKVDKRSVSDSFNQSAYTHEDRIKSVWYTDNPREVNRRPNERPTLLPRNSSTPGNS